MQRFAGIWVALATPFHNDELDLPALRSLVRRLASAGVAGLVVCGSTGEAAALSEAEQLIVLDTVIETVPDCPVVMGLAGNNLRSVMARLHDMQKRPLAGILAPPPYYIRPSQAGLATYFETLADASDVPLLLYNIPYRTAVAIEFETFARLAQHERIVGVKDCGGDQMLTMRLIAETGLQVLTGEDSQLLSNLALGGAGGIMAAAHLRPDLFVEIFANMQAGRMAEARAVFYRLLPLIRLLFAEPNPGPLKAALAITGEMHNDVRSPMQSASGALTERLGAVLHALDIA
ncbi:MAG TPA: 4-hydroxy-tetrahydrodipicolinate synthase [Noviherbaspirillum sp.]|jgi:4-hydroxy-tetrahydrodipicolinate synthase